MNKPIVHLIALTCTVVVMLADSGQAQDTNYWSLQYGTRSELLTGATTGSLMGLSNTYYNPGGLSLIKDPTLILSTLAFALENITAENSLGTDVDLVSNRIASLPSFFAGRLDFDSSRRHQFAYSFLTRQEMKLRVDGKLIESYEPPGGGGSVSSFAGEGFFSQDLSEVWGGLTWSHRPRTKFGIGITQYVAIRSQTTRRQTIAQVVQETGESAALISLDEFSYNHWRLLWKLGMAVDLEPLTLGLTVTTPSLGLFGSGSSFINASLLGVDLDDDGTEDPFLASNYQKDLSSHYQSPWAVAAGASYLFNHTTLHLSAEWFNAVKNFTVVAAEDFRSQTSGLVIRSSAEHELKSVVNFGLGIEQNITEKFSLTGSFATDYSARSPGSDISISSWDIYHITAGSRFYVKGFELTLGVEHAFGSSLTLTQANFNPDNPSDVLDEERTTATRYGRWEFMVGFSYGFLDGAEKN